MKWNTWDRFEVEGQMTVGEFVEHFRREHQLEVTMIACGDFTLYFNLFKPTLKAKRLAQT